MLLCPPNQVCLYSTYKLHKKVGQGPKMLSAKSGGLGEFRIKACIFEIPVMHA